MSTFKDLTDIAVVGRTGVELYIEAMEDGKLDFSDLTDNLDKLLTLAGQVRDAVIFEEGFELKELSKAQIKDLLEYNLHTVFLFTGTSEAGEEEATFKELNDIFLAMNEGAQLFYSMCADGKLTVTDIITNLKGIIDFSLAIRQAAKLDGTIDIGTLNEKQMLQLFDLLVDTVDLVIEAIKLLKTE